MLGYSRLCSKFNTYFRRFYRWHFFSFFRKNLDPRCGKRPRWQLFSADRQLLLLMMNRPEKLRIVKIWIKIPPLCHRHHRKLLPMEKSEHRWRQNQALNQKYYRMLPNGWDLVWADVYKLFGFLRTKDLGILTFTNLLFKAIAELIRCWSRIFCESSFIWKYFRKFLIRHENFSTLELLFKCILEIVFYGFGRE